MAVNFFEKEVKKARENFNKVFGNRTVCNLQVRYSSLLAVCWLGVLSANIMKVKDKKMAKGSIEEFYRARDVLNNFFNLMENQEERRYAAHSRKDSNNRLTGYVKK